MANFCRTCFTKHKCPKCRARQRDVDRFVALFSLEMLTTVRYEHWRALPESAGIYFALSETGTVVYIGQTQNLMIRWATNYRNLYHCGVASIGFILITKGVLWRLCAERALINKYKPTHCGIRKVPGPKLGPRTKTERQALQQAAKQLYGFI